MNIAEVKLASLQDAVSDTNPLSDRRDVTIQIANLLADTFGEGTFSDQGGNVRLSANRGRLYIETYDWDLLNPSMGPKVCISKQEPAATDKFTELVLDGLLTRWLERKASVDKHHREQVVSLQTIKQWFVTLPSFDKIEERNMNAE